MVRSWGFGLLGVLAAGAGAIMIPPTVVTSVTGSNHGPGALGLVDPYTQLLEIACPGCAYAQPSDGAHGFVWTKGVENSLFVNVSVGSNPETLELNGVQFYPPLLPLTAEPDPIFVTQAPRNTPLNEIRKHEFSKLRLTGWSFIAEKAHTVNESGEEIITLRLSLRALERQAIEVDDIVITLLKNSHGQLMLLKTETQPKPPSLHSSKECKNWPLLCQWRATLAQKLDKARGKFKGKCHKKPNGHHGGMAGQIEDGKRPHHHHGRPPHRRPHMGHHKWQHHHHKEHHETMHKIARFLLTIVIPILIGILTGMLTYLVGMLIGTGFALLWARIRSRRARGYQRVALNEAEEQPVFDASEKEVVPVEQYADAPPQYVEAEAPKEGQN